MKKCLSNKQKHMLSLCNDFVLTLKKTSVSRSILVHLNNSDMQIQSLKTTSTTRFAEFLYLHLESILKNLPEILNIIPKIIDGNECQHYTDDLALILKNLGSPLFVAEMINIAHVYFEASMLEKKAQSESFGAFDYLEAINKFKESLTGKLKKTRLSSNGTN